MSDEHPTFDDAQARITKALGLIDVWLDDESPNDGEQRRSVWRGIREIRSALSRCAHPDVRRKTVDGDVWCTDWKCEDCDRRMIVNVDLSIDEVRKVLDGDDT